MDKKVTRWTCFLSRIDSPQWGWAMPGYQVQQFHECEDDFLLLGDLQTLDLTEGEVTRLQESDGEAVVWLDGRGGYLGLASEEPVVD